eukprot:5784735-Amphidinium_carterae.1
MACVTQNDCKQRGGWSRLAVSLVTVADVDVRKTTRYTEHTTHSSIISARPLNLSETDIPYRQK